MLGNTDSQSNPYLRQIKKQVVLSSLGSRQTIPGDSLRAPSDFDQEVVFILVWGIVMRACFGIGVVLSKQRNRLSFIGIPADALVLPAKAFQFIALIDRYGVVVVTGIIVIEAVDRNGGKFWGNPANAFIFPANVDQKISFNQVFGIEVFT